MTISYNKRRLAATIFIPALLMVALFSLACGGSEPAAQPQTATTGQQQPAQGMSDTTPAGGSKNDMSSGSEMLMNLEGSITIDGSSTVFPVSEAVAEEFGILTGGNVRVTVGLSGSGGGFKKFCNGETDISNASRPIKGSEVAACAEAGIEFVEVPVAIDGLSVMTNPANDYIDCMTIAELHTLWGPDAEGSVMKWNQIRPEWPDENIRLYGPGVDSGTFDYFTEVVNGEGGASRGDYTASEDDNVLVQGISGDKHSLGFFGYAYYAENQDKLKLVGVDGGAGCVTPNDATIEDGRYQPLARPLFIYIRKDSLAKPYMAEYARFHLSAEGGQQLVRDVGYLPYPQEVYTLAQDRVTRGLAGTLFGGDNPQKGPVASVLANNASGQAPSMMAPDFTALEGSITIDGSSTVFPVSEAVAEEFGILTSGNVRVTVGLSGSGGGFKKFCNGETDISNASRPIKGSEVAACAEAGIEYVEVPVAIDGLSVMTNPSNNYIDCMTIAELHTLWGPDAEDRVTRWNQVRPDWPDEEIRLYGPGVDSGTFDYFTEVVNHEGGASRGDYTASEDDNVLVQGIAGDKHSLGFFGYAYYVENQDKLRLVGIDGGAGCVTPNDATIEDGSYQPLARPLFIYIRKDALANPHIEAFANFHLSPEGGQQLVRDVGYLPYPQEVYTLAQDRVTRGLAGTLFGGDNPQKGPVAAVLASNK